MMEVKDKTKLKFKIMDMIWSLKAPEEIGEEASVNIEINDVEYDLTVAEARELNQKLNEMIN